MAASAKKKIKKGEITSQTGLMVGDGGRELWSLNQSARLIEQMIWEHVSREPLIDRPILPQLHGLLRN